MSDAIEKARRHFARLAFLCLLDAENGVTPVNDLDSYREDQWATIRSSLSGDYDHTFTFRQMATFFETGECRPLLAPVEA